MQPALQPIREQLMNPSAVTLPSLSMYDPNGNPGRHELWVVKEPAEHQSSLVISGRRGVFLPLPNDPRSLEELARSLGARADGPVVMPLLAADGRGSDSFHQQTATGPPAQAQVGRSKIG